MRSGPGGGEEVNTPALYMSYQACYIAEEQRASLCFRAFGNERSIQINKLVSKLYPCMFDEEQEHVWMPLHVVIYWVGSSFLGKVGMPSYNQEALH